MSTTATVEAADERAALPTLNEAISIGPPEYIAGRAMRLAKHTGTGKYFRMGEREVFLLQHLDGCHTSEQIRQAYVSRFGKHLTDGSLQKAITLFASRGLLAGQQPDASLQAASLDLTPASVQSGPFSRKILFWSPDQRLTAMIPYCRWLINGPSFAAWGLVILLFEVLVVANRTALWHDFVSLSPSTWIVRGIAVLGFSAFVMTFHEFGHGLACKRFGGEVQEMGYLFRYFNFCAYTRIDDILLFHKRLHRIYVLLFGPLISLSAIPLAFAAWLYFPHASRLHTVACDVLIWYNLSCLIQLIPFLQFDGYFIVAQLLRMPDLRKDSYNYLLKWLLTGFRTRPAVAASECPAYLVPTYIGYGLFSAVFSSLAIGYVLMQYGQTIFHAIGLWPSLFVLVSALGGAGWRLSVVTLPWIKTTYRQLRPVTQ